jgi:hypothetical protein
VPECKVNSTERNYSSNKYQSAFRPRSHSTSIMCLFDSEYLISIKNWFCWKWRILISKCQEEWKRISEFEITWILKKLATEFTRQLNEYYLAKFFLRSKLFQLVKPSCEANMFTYLQSFTLSLFSRWNESIQYLPNLSLLDPVKQNPPSYTSISQVVSCFTCIYDGLRSSIRHDFIFQAISGKVP